MWGQSSACRSMRMVTRSGRSSSVSNCGRRYACASQTAHSCTCTRDKNVSVMPQTQNTKTCIVHKTPASRCHPNAQTAHSHILYPRHYVYITTVDLNNAHSKCTPHTDDVSAPATAVIHPCKQQAANDDDDAAAAAACPLPTDLIGRPIAPKYDDCE